MFQAKRVCCFVHFLLLFISRIQNENATRDTNNKWASFSYILPIGNAKGTKYERIQIHSTV